MNKLRIKKEYGEWMYKRIRANDYNDLDADIYELYKVVDGRPIFENTFGSYGDMKYFIEMGIVI